MSVYAARDRNHHELPTHEVLGVVLINAVIGYIQESRAEPALDALGAMARTTAAVVRDGAAVRISSDGVVPGDLVRLEAGDMVPADLPLTAVSRRRCSAPGP